MEIEGIGRNNFSYRLPAGALAFWYGRCELASLPAANIASNPYI